MDICSKCEKVILSDYKFCPRCGHSIYGKELSDSVNKINPVLFESTDVGAMKFFSIAQKLSASDDLDNLLKLIGEALEDILAAERSAILLLDDSGKFLYFKTASGEDILKKLMIPIDQGIAGWIATKREPDIVNDPYNDERFSPETDKKTGFKTKSIIAAPMILGNDLIGVVEAINKKDGLFNNQDLQTLLGFASLAAVSIADTKRQRDQKNFFSNMLDFLVIGCDALGTPEPTEKGHSWEMARYAPQLGKELGFPEKKLSELVNAALIHDIGFLGLENTDLVGIRIDTELNNEAKFRLHPVIGGKMVKGIKMMQTLGPYILYHHRYVNSTGFPDNISPTSITKEIEIISILESFFMSGEDKNKIPPEQFSSDVYNAFMKIISI